MAGPRIVTINNSGRNGGIQCCCCRCCTCINVQYLRSQEGVLKIAQVCLGLLSQSLLLHYGRPYAATMGPAYDSAVTATASCLLTAGLLLGCHAFAGSKASIPSSLFDPLFNSVAAFLHASASASLSFATNTYLWPQYVVLPFYQVFPAMVAAYLIGFALAVVHGFDGYLAWKRYRGYH